MKNTFTCCLCKRKFEGYGNNPAPVLFRGRCCDKCNRQIVLIVRLKLLSNKKD
nr:MAG TPA: Recombination endonuclease VII [Caudoviricetes sp.]